MAQRDRGHDAVGELDEAPLGMQDLEAALDQYGPWRGKGFRIDKTWLESALLERIRAIEWPVAAQDVAPFLAAPEQAGLKLWGERFFAGKVAKLVLGL